MLDRYQRIMIAVDETEASLKAVQYVARMMAGRKDVHVRLFHVLPPLPPDLLEHGGSELPEQEQLLSDQLRMAQHKWTAQARQSAQRSLDSALVVLVEHGIPSQNLSTAFSTSVNPTDISAEILRAAGEWDCATVVTGRHDLPWMQEILHRHVGDQVVQSGKDTAVTVVPS